MRGRYINSQDEKGDTIKEFSRLATLYLGMVALGGQESIAQLGWYQQTSGTSARLYHVILINADTGIAVGDSGAILRTTNGGTSWTSQLSGTSSPLRSVSFISPDTGLAVGNAGVIQRTTDGGVSWSSQQSVQSYSLLGVSFVNPNIGIAVGDGGARLRTTDSGITWTQPSGFRYWYLDGISFTTLDTATIVGFDAEGIGVGLILRTTDGGTEWIRQNLPSTAARNYLHGVSFVNTDLGWAVGSYGTILNTTNGGTSWTFQNSGTAYHLLGVWFTDASTGTVVGDAGTILRTTNGGLTWTNQLSGTTSTLRSVFFSDLKNGAVVGDGGIILRTTSGGTVSVESGGNSGVPAREFKLQQNYPNPFNPTTKIEFRIANFGLVSLKVFDLLGREVATLVNEELNPASYEREFVGNGLASGIYLYQLKAGAFVQTKKLALLR